MPQASIIIPVLNQLAFTRNCLEALFRRTPASLFELILMDNGSTDATPDYMSTLTHPLRYLRFEKNLGFAAACNQAAQTARCEYLVFLNNDTLPQAGWLEALLELLQRDPSAGVAGPRLLWPNGTLQEAGALVFSDATTCHIGNRDDPSKDLYQQSYEVDYCSSACLVTRRGLFQEVGGFDTRYAPYHYECADYCFQIRERGFKTLYAPDSVVIHYQGMTPLEKGVTRDALIESQRHKFAAKWREELRFQPAPPVETGRMMVETRQGLKFPIGKWYYIGNNRVLKKNLERFVLHHLREPRKIALYGAGKHTQRLLALQVIPREQIAVIFDDVAAATSLEGIPVLKPAQAGQASFDLVLVSSDSIWEDLQYRARQWAPKGCPIISLYDDGSDDPG